MQTTSAVVGDRVEILAGDHKGEHGVVASFGFLCDRHRRKNGCMLLYDVRLDSGATTFVASDDARTVADGVPEQATLW